MNHTTNYQLNQWELHDRVMMQDFNSDNAKIDAALKAEADERAAETAARQTAVAAAEDKIMFVKLLDMTVQAATNQVDIDVSKLKLTQYYMLKLHFAPSANSEKGVVHLLCNGETDAYYNGTVGPYESLSSFSTSPGYMTQQVVDLYLGDGIAAMSKGSYRAEVNGKDSVGMSQSTVYLGWPKSTSQLKKLRLKVDEPGTLGKGTTIHLYGLRK